MSHFIHRPKPYKRTSLRQVLLSKSLKSRKFATKRPRFKSQRIRYRKFGPKHPAYADSNRSKQRYRIKMLHTRHTYRFNPRLARRNPHWTDIQLRLVANKDIRHYNSMVQTEIPSVDGEYQVSPFFGDQGDPSIYHWFVPTIPDFENSPASCGFWRVPQWVVDYWNERGVEVRLNPIRMVFDSELAFTLFLLRWA